MSAFCNIGCRWTGVRKFQTRATDELERTVQRKDQYTGSGKFLNQRIDAKQRNEVLQEIVDFSINDDPRNFYFDKTQG